jgi:hypothetical protein
MEASLFDQITSALTVQSLYSSLAPDIPSGSGINDSSSKLPSALFILTAAGILPN